jgi:hypothetical protein
LGGRRKSGGSAYRSERLPGLFDVHTQSQRTMGKSGILARVNCQLSSATRQEPDGEVGLMLLCAVPAAGQRATLFLLEYRQTPRKYGQIRANTG